MSTVVNKIKETLKEHRMSVRELARRAEISPLPSVMRTSIS